MAWYSDLVLLFSSLFIQEIEDFHVVKGCAIDKAQQVYVVRRSFKKSGISYVLALETESLKSRVLKVSKLQSIKECENSTYERLKKEALLRAKPLQNAGITQGDAKGYALSVDMCPSSKKGYERDFFLSLSSIKKPFPVTISITAKWIRFHKASFFELLRLEKRGDVAIIWMNHGFNHPYKKGLPLKENFILSHGADRQKELLQTEKVLLSYGLVPSIFYRFAGLVSHEAIIKRMVNEYGLIPLGSLAWLAKGETIQNGSIVLVHGNRNEPQGVRRFLELKPEDVKPISALFTKKPISYK